MESLMQYVWQFRLWPIGKMYTNDGRRLQVIDPGLLNHDAGPDFFNAKIKIDGEEWIGNIEIHVKASDWHKHHHDGDKAYDSVILHVVDVDDTKIYRSNGEVIPQYVMHCAPDFAQKYNEMVYNRYRELPCGNELSSVPRLYVEDWLTSLTFERLYAKADRITQYLKHTNYNWSEAIYITLSRALGFSTNSVPFELLAQSTPLKHMLHHTDRLLSIEAILFGQSGLLEDLDNTENQYIQNLKSEYQFLCAKYTLSRSQNIVWKMSKMRPNNTPHRRIAALAQLIYHNTLFSNRILEIKNEDEARALFDIKLEGFWASHCNFTSDESAYSAKAFGISSINTLLINVVVPVIFAYALATGNDKRQEFAVDLLQGLKPESNRIIDTFSHAGIDATDAFTSQGMIQLKRDYCEPRKCLYCRIGHRLLSYKANK